MKQYYLFGKKNMINNSIKKAFHSISFYLIIILFHLPFFIYGKNGYLQILDVLNAEFIYNHLLKISNNLFNLNQFTEIENVIGGWKILYIHSQFKIIKLFYYLFDSYYAYVLHSIFIRCLGFYAIKLLFRHFYGKLKYENLVFLIYSLLPGLTIFGGCLWSIPFLILAFSQISVKLNYLSFLWIFIYLITSAPYQFPFIFSFILLFFIYKFYKTKKINYEILYCGLFFLFVGLILEYNLLISIFSTNKEIISHRVEDFNNILFPSTLGVIYQYFKIALFGEYNPSHFFSIPIIVLSIYFFVKNKLKNSSNILFYYSLIFVFITLKIFTPQIISMNIPIVTSFGIEKKILYFIPICYFLILGELMKKINIKRIVIITLCALLVFNILRNTEISYNLFGKSSHVFVDEDYLFKSKIFGELSKSNYFDIDEFSSLYYDEYFSVDLFNLISKHINKDKSSYRIINLGISPSVTLFNGFYNLDGYLSNHSRSYNSTFDSIQVNYSVLNQHKLVLKYKGFSDICKNCTKSDSITNVVLDLNREILEDLKCSYIFSAFEISNSKNLNLSLLKKFQISNSPYQIFVYEL